MSLEEIAFFLDSDIYLLEESTDNQIITEKFRFYGENKSHVCFFLHYEGTLTKSADFDLFQKILSAVKLTLLEVCLVNIAENDDFNWQDIQAIFAPKKAVFFGVEPAKFGIPTRLAIHSPQTYLGTKLLWAAPLPSIGQDKSVKLEFWSAFKELFN